MLKLKPALAAALLLSNTACIKRPPETPIHLVGKMLHEKVYHCLDHHVFLPEVGGLKVKKRSNE